MDFKTSISQKELEVLPIGNFDGEIIIIENIDQYKQVLPLIKDVKLFGFDTETRPNFKKGDLNKVALLQLSTKQQAFLFRLHEIGLPKELCKILSSSKIIKTGVAIKDDISQLQKIKLFAPAGFVELQKMVEDYGIKDKSLKKLAGIILGVKISKRQQTSNWENPELTDAQIQYAANDAWVSLEIYRMLKQEES